MMRTIKLERLSRQTIGELSASMLGEDIGRQAQLIELLERESEGNVFFIVEVVRAVVEVHADARRGPRRSREEAPEVHVVEPDLPRRRPLRQRAGERNRAQDRRKAGKPQTPSPRRAVRTRGTAGSPGSSLRAAS